MVWLAPKSLRVNFSGSTLWKIWWQGSEKYMWEIFFFLGRFAKIWFSRKINAVPFLPYYVNSDNNKLWINQLILSMIDFVLNINLLTTKIRILFHFYLMFLQIYNSFFWKDKMFCISFGCWKFLNFLSNKILGNYCFENIRLIQSFFPPLSGLD